VNRLELGGLLAQVLRDRADREPDTLAFRFLVDGEEQEACLTYAQLDRSARQVAACLAERGAAGERVLLVHPPGLAYIESFYGCLYAGAVAVPAYPPRLRQRAEGLGLIAQDSGARFALTTAAVEARLREDGDLRLSRLDWLPPELVSQHDPDRHVPRKVVPGTLAALQYTSGSTTAPRGVMLSQENLAANATMILEAARIGPDDRGVAWLPPYHDMGLIGFIVAPVLTGGPATLLSPIAFIQRPLRWLRAVSRHQATVTGGPDFAYRLCAQRATPAQIESLDLSQLRIAFSGAERIQPETMDAFAKAFAPAGFRREAFSPSYGLAEATLAVSMRPPGRGPLVGSFDAAALREGRVAEGASRVLAGSGAPLPGVEVRVVDPESLAEQPAGRVGEIWVRSPSVARGYWNQPELSGRAFQAPLEGVPHLRTGDLGFVHEGELFISGRLKELLVFQGVNHHPEDVEVSSGKAHPRLRTGVAFSVEADGEEKLVLAHEVDRARDDLPVDEIGQAVRLAVAAEHELPVHEVVLLQPGALPKTSSGKLQRGKARALYLEGALRPVGTSRRAAGGEAPPEMVQAIRSLFAAVLGVAAVGPDEDFFALGGHSLLATQLASRVRETLGTDLPLRAIFESPTPRALAARLRECPPADRIALPSVRDPRALPLSFSQERMWYQHQLDPAGSAYNVAGALRIDGPLDVAALERALRAVVDRHEVLRSNYLSDGGVPRAVVAGSMPLELPVVDLTAEPDPDAAAASLVAGFAALPFDLARDPLIRARLYRTRAQQGDARHVMAVSLHHVVADGWSLGLLLAELLRGYHGAPAPGPAPRYFDYAAFERQHASGERLSRGLSFWTENLRAAPMLRLPADRARPQRRSSQGSFLPVALPPELIASLRALARAEGATLSLVMLAAFEVLLARTCGQGDIVIGTPVANRGQLASESLIGSLVNTLPLRFRVDPTATFSELLRALRETSLQAWAHQDVPFERIVSALQVERSAAESPLFQVMFDFQNAPMPGRAAGGLRLTPVLFSSGASQFDLSLFILDSELGNAAGVAYSTELFEPETIERFCARYVRVLEAIAARPELRVSRIPLLSPAERAALISAPEGSEPPPRDLVHRLFEAQARRTPDAPAVIDEHGVLNYRDLDTLANGLAWRLREAGAGPGRRVAVFLERGSRMVMALLAVLKSGAAYVPLDPRYPPERITFLLEDCDPAVLLTSENLRDRLAVPASVKAVNVEGSAPAFAPLAPAPAEDAAAYVIYTSGSTGRPKGVEVGHFAVANFLRSMGREPGLGQGDRLLSVTSISFDIAALEIFLPLTRGASVHVAPGDVASDGFRLARLVQASSATVLQATPSTWRLLLEAGWQGSPRLKLLCGGEPLSRELADQLLARGAELWNLYGPTETTIWSAVERVRPGAGPVLIGRPIDHTSIYVLDPGGEPVPKGVVGELFIGGAGVARGYFRRPELTEQRFVPDPFGPPGARMYRTGDAGRLRNDGSLECLGRLDQQVKIRGHRIEPGEIEQVLRESAQVRDAVVVAREHGLGDVRLAAYYVPADPPPDPDDLRELCRRRLPEHMVPASFTSLTALPLTPNGKLDRNALPRPGEAKVSLAPRIAPRDELEEQLAELWREVLGGAAPGVTDSFYRSGGDSLLAVRLFALIEQRLGVSPPLAVLAEEPTVEHLAASVRALRQAKPEARRRRSLVTLQPRGARRPLFCVHGAGGNVLNLPEVARALGHERPFFALQADGVDGRTELPANVEEMAAAYLTEVREAQPHGPYLLSGYCGGGLVAYEMARQLREAGETVATLVLIDLWSPGTYVPRSRLRDWLRSIVDETFGELIERARAKVVRDVGLVVRSLLVRFYQARRRPLPYALRDFWLTTTFLRKAAQYRLDPYPGKLVVFRAREDEKAPAPDLGWSRFARGGVAAYEVPGDHHSLTQEPNVQVLAAQLAAVLRCADGET
jgi:amino acid adenylation domain-containing protein